MNTIITSQTVLDNIAALEATGKMAWVIATETEVLGVYAGRTSAREDKATFGYAGKIMKAAELTLTTATVVAAVAPEDKAALEDALNSGSVHGFKAHGFTHCPACGCHLSNGVGQDGDEVNGKVIHHDRFEFQCLGCNHEFGAPVARNAKVAKVKPAAGTPRAMISTVARPTKMVWFIADEMQAKNPAVRRKDVIAECVARGIAFLTARTQYQQWFEVQREMAERVAATTAAAK